MGELERALEGARRVAIVGVAKNSGKTTTLNALLAALSGRPVGLMSVGIDGEERDLLIGTPKPVIRVEAGMWVVSAADALAASTARVEYVASLGFETLMGAVSLARVVSTGEVMLAGLRHSEDVRRAALLLEDVAGAGPVLIDGAYGRTVAARGDLSDGVIVSTGAILGGSVSEVVEGTAALTARLTLPGVRPGWERALVERAVREERALLGGAGGEVWPLRARSALVGLAGSGELWTREVRALAVPGLVSDRVVEELLAVPQWGESRVVLVQDGTALQASARLLRRLERAGWEVRAWQTTRLLGLSYNPTSISGARLEDEALRAALREHYGEALPIFNPWLARESGPGG